MMIETRKIVKTALRTLQRLLRAIHSLNFTVHTHNSVELLSTNNSNVKTHMAQASCRHNATFTKRRGVETWIAHFFSKLPLSRGVPFPESRFPDGTLGAAGRWEEIKRNGLGPLEKGLGVRSGADFHVDDVDAATE